MKKHIALLAASLLAASTASAFIIIDTVPVGDVGNASELPGVGDVGYDYHIGTYEVTNSQYTAFLNATAATDMHSLYNLSMGSSSFGGINRTGSSGSYTYSVKSGFDNKPVNFVSFWDAARFSNWLTNGQPTGAQGTGTTEEGMYNLGGVTNPTNTSVTRQLDFSVGQNGVAIASENEWYKAAYYDPTLNSGSGGYTLYPTQSDTAPTAENPPGGANSANSSGGPGTVTDVGAYTGSDSHYGTFDQGGNVWEWNDSSRRDTSKRELRGGSLFNDVLLLSSPNARSFDPTSEYSEFGFRVSSLEPIPEPSAYAAILGCLGLTIAAVRRKGRLPISDCR